MAYVLSSVSGNLISAASAGFAPTNSADVSAIASSYQVVSATATQLYAGTAYLTSVNDNPISASRAGQAANASMANSAYYDGTGRLISALPDEATVSAIASAYADSAASSKQDTLTFGYNTADKISSIDGSALGGMDEAAVSAIASAYAESAASSKQDTLTFGYNAEDKISSINGSSLAGEGGGGGLVTAIGTSESGITSINNSGLVDTAALRSADYSSLYVQEPLYISASGDSSYIGISGDVGGVDSATCSAIASAYAESAASSKLDSSASSSFYGIDNPSGFLTTAYTPTFGYNTADQISSIDGSALGGMDEAAVSGIASAYAESAVSSVSGNYYTTANESGFLTAQVQASWSESASASPSYIQDKPDLVDIVAGPGIVVDNPDGNTLRVSMAQDYEVTLWSGSCLTQGSPAVSLSESASNFEKIEIYAIPNPSDQFNSPQIFTYPGSNTAGAYICPFMTTGLKGKFGCGLWTITNRTSFNLVAAGQTDSYPSQNWDNTYGGVVKIVGINRTASAQ